MDKMEGIKNLLAEVAQFIGKAANERMESEEFHKILNEINRRMSDQYGCVIGAIGVAMEFNFVTVAVRRGEKEKRSKKTNLSLNFRFGQSKEDEVMGEILGLGKKDFEEMNEALKQAREGRVDGKGKKNITPPDAEAASQPPAETEEAAESLDPRSISQIINSIRTFARALNFEQRQSLVKKIRSGSEIKILSQHLAFVTDEQIKNDTAWLQCVQNLINEIQGCREPKALFKITFLALEELFKRVSIL